MEKDQKINTKRMTDLISKMDENGAIVRESEEKVVNNNDDVKKQSEKFRALVHGGRQIDENYMSPTNYPMGGMGQTVNTFVDKTEGNSMNRFGVEKDGGAKPAVNTGLTPKEALEIGIRRTLDSGKPINDISFYDEINWNLEKMGFDYKLPLDIKNAIKDIINYGQIKG